MIREASYYRSVRAALNVLRETDADSFPINLKRVLRFRNVKLKTYEEIVSTGKYSLQDCFTFFGEDGAAIFYPAAGRYVIAYNSHSRSSHRKRFTIAHELGHIVLGHHSEYGAPVLKRYFIEKPLYDVLEDEANCFARNLLSPPMAANSLLRLHGYTFSQFDKRKDRNVWIRVPGAAVVNDPPRGLSDSFFIQNAFFITNAAAETRCHFLKSDLMYTPMAEAESLLSRFRFTSRWRCRACGAPKIDGASYCYNCGEEGRFGYFSKNPEPERPVFLRYMGGQFISCPFCGNGRIPAGSYFCTVCGQPVSNPCMPAADVTSGSETLGSDTSCAGIAARMLPRQQEARQAGSGTQRFSRQAGGVNSISHAYRSRGHVFSYLQRISSDASIRSATHMNPVGANYCLSCGMPTLYGLMYAHGSNPDCENQDQPSGLSGSSDHPDAPDPPPEYFEYGRRLRIESAITRSATYSAVAEDSRSAITTGEIPTVKYGPNIPYEEQYDERFNDRVFKVTKCPRCLNEDIEDDAAFCIICGMSLLNMCDGYYESGISGDPIQHSNPSNARFCHICGSPTAYSRLKILPPYRVALEKMRKEKEQEDLLRRELAERDIDPDLFFDDEPFEGRPE